MGKQSSLAIDAWIREAQQVSKLVEDLETKIKINNFEQHHRLKDIAKSKVLEVGVKLDRLESLLLNPPSKPILTLEDLEFRWNMLSDFRLRTRALAATIYPSSSRKGARDLSDANTQETSKSTNINDQEHINPFLLKDESEMLKPFISDNEAESLELMRQTASFTPMSILKKLCWIILLILGAAVLLFLVVIICAVI